MFAAEIKSSMPSILISLEAAWHILSRILSFAGFGLSRSAVSAPWPCELSNSKISVNKLTDIGLCRPWNSRSYTCNVNLLSISPCRSSRLQDDAIVFSAPTAYFVLDSPAFGLALLITLCLTECMNGVIKLYTVRPRPLWVSSTLKRKGDAWEKVRLDYEVLNIALV